MYKNMQYLTYTDIDKRMTNNIATFVLGGHMT